MVLEALALTRACYRRNPKSIVRVFSKLEKLLKRIGNKHLLEELADLTVAAAERPPHEVDDAMARALALLCGKSWALQRMGDLAGARYYAKQNLDLCEAIPWPRNTAFCLKCTGRIFRLEAELESDSTESRRMLEGSLQMLTDAIEKFSHARNRTGTRGGWRLLQPHGANVLRREKLLPGTASVTRSLRRINADSLRRLLRIEDQ